MPFGISFFGTAFDEYALIGIAYAFEQETKMRLSRRAVEEAIPKTQLKMSLANGRLAGSTIVAPRFCRVWMDWVNVERIEAGVVGGRLERGIPIRLPWSGRAVVMRALV